MSRSLLFQKKWKSILHRENNMVKVTEVLRATGCSWSSQVCYKRDVDSIQEMERNEAGSWQGLILWLLSCPAKECK